MIAIRVCRCHIIYEFTRRATSPAHPVNEVDIRAAHTASMRSGNAKTAIGRPRHTLIVMKRL